MERKITICKCYLKKLDSHMGTDGQDMEPKEDDLSVCIYCATISKFDKDLNLSPISVEELDIIKLIDFDAWVYLQRASSLIMAKIRNN